MPKDDTRTIAAKISPQAYTELKLLGFRTHESISAIAGRAVEEYLRNAQAVPSVEKPVDGE